MLHKVGLADSVADGRRKLKEHAVRIDGKVETQAAINGRPLPVELMVRVGRRFKRVRITDGSKA
jgi:hypothetical protein